MTDGVNISNRDIYDAVQEISSKLDEHLTEHRVRAEVEGENTTSRRYRLTTWVAIAATFATGFAGWFH